MNKILLLSITFAINGICYGQNMKLSYPVDTKYPNTPFSDKYADNPGQFKAEFQDISTYELINAWFALNKIKDDKINILRTAKNPYLKTAPATMIVPGAEVYSSDKGKIEIIYAIKDVEGSPYWAGRIYSYLISYDASGKYIDSLMASETIIHTPADNNFFESISYLISYNDGTIQQQKMDGGDTYMEDYYFTSQLKFIKKQ